MAIKINDILGAFNEIGNLRNLPEETIREALSEAMEKAYKKSVSDQEAKVRTEFENGQLKIFAEFDVVEDPTNPELQISLEEARKIKPDAEIGDVVDKEVDFKKFDRAAVILAKSVMKQKIREAEKVQVYEEYSDQLDDMVMGVVESVEDKFVLVRLGLGPDGKPKPGSTLAMMRKKEQIPTEYYHDGQRMWVVITDVSKETKGAQVLVSRASPTFIKRLFEREVPEIFNGTIEIKAIARDPGARAKIAVISNNENIDPIGACIGPRGSRVQAIIQELNGEKIDIFEWSDNVQDLVANALSPAQDVVVIPNPNVKNGLYAVVPDNQLSLAIGKKGQNARLAVRLSNYKIDIKSQKEMEEMGINYRLEADKMHDEYERKKAAERAYKQQQRIEELKAGIAETEEFPFEDQELVPPVKTHKEPEAISAEEKAKLDDMEQAAKIAKEKRRSLADRRAQYTSKLEPVAPVSEPTAPSKKKEKKTEKKTIKKQPVYNQFQPIYTEDELKEIEEEEYEQELNASWNNDVDYDEYDEYYDEEY